MDMMAEYYCLLPNEVSMELQHVLLPQLLCKAKLAPAIFCLGSAITVSFLVKGA